MTMLPPILEVQQLNDAKEEEMTSQKVEVQVSAVGGGGGFPSQGKSHTRKGSLTDVWGSAGNPQRLGLPKRAPDVAQMLEDWVAAHGGSRPIHSVLVANNGLAAVKFMRSVRSWASQTLGNPRAISLLAMATPNDMRSNAEHISLADQFVEVPGGPNHNNYANVALIVQMALRAGVDAVWPGWGHASENPELPAALAERGIVFLGPPSSAMAALGDKIGSTILAQAADVPTLPWSGSGIRVSYAECDGVIPETTYAQACLPDVEAAVAACDRIGYPAMLKASWGGGGKGIRKVCSSDEVRGLYRQVAGEVPGSPIFAMKLAPVSRHLEVQLLCDAHGGVASLMSRDCSVQRRHQKIVEEGPVTAAPQEVLRSMEACARALARSVGYVGAATVEFLYCIDEGQHYFLELNPRLQVEHPVTEGITGVNIPACQLLIGMGLPLWRIPQLRALYNQDPAADTPFDPDITEQRAADCHVVAVRITAEDAADGFKPTAGRIDELFFRPTPEVWGYFSMKSGGAIHEFSDSQFGHVFAHGASREAALRCLSVALRDLVVRGEIRTIVDYAIDMLQSPDLINNQVHTGWLDSRIARKVPGAQPAWHLAVIAGAVVRAHQAVSAQSAEYLGFLGKGQLPPASISLVSFSESLIIGGVKYCVDVVRRGPTSFCVTLNGSHADVITRKMADGGFLMQVDGESHVVHVEEEAAGTRLALGPTTCLLAKETDPSKLMATSPGKLVRYLVTPGSHLEQDQPFAEVEVMKMMMPLLAPAAGVVSFMLPEGAVMSAGDLIGRLELDDALSVVRAERFTGVFPELGLPVLPSDRPDHRLTAALEAVKHVLAGYVQPVESVAAELVVCLDAPALALGQWADEMSVVRARLPPALVSKLDTLTFAYEDAITQAEQVAALTGGGGGAAGGTAAPVGAPAHGNSSVTAGAGGARLMPVPEFPAAELEQAMFAALEETAPAERSALFSCLAALMDITVQHKGGKEAYARRVVQELLESFLTVEERFRLGGHDGPGTEQEAIHAMRQVASSSVEVLDAVMSHQGLPRKADLVSRLLAALVLPAPAHYRSQLRRIAALRGSVKGMAALASRAAALLEHSLLADLRVVVARALSGLDMFSTNAPPAVQPKHSPSPSLGPPAHLDGTDETLDALLTTPAAAKGAGAAQVVRRKTTAVEGLFLGLPVGLVAGSSVVGGGSPLGSPPTAALPHTSPSGGGGHLGPHVSRVATAAVENKMEMLVSVPAAVEDALSSLIVDMAMEPYLLARAAVTLVRRMHHPFLLNEPHLQHLPSGVMLVTWLYDTPQAANTAQPQARAGVLLVVPDVQQLEQVVAGHLREALAQLGMQQGPASLHIAIAGEVVGVSPPAATSATVSVPVIEDTTQACLVSSGCADMQPDSPQLAAIRKLMSDTVSRHTLALHALGVDCVTCMARSPTGILPIRMGYTWQPSGPVATQAAPALDATAAGEAAPAQVPGAFKRDRFLSQADSVTCELLELSKLVHYSSLQYAPSRNRQYQLYTGIERPDARSYPVRRLYVRGLVRQLTSPSLLAASYGGSPSAVASAVVEEVESHLVGALEEVMRLHHTSGDAPAGHDSAGSPDWVHVFCSVLPAMPLAPHGLGALLQRGGEGAVPRGHTRPEYDAKVAGALKVAGAGLVARHLSQLRQAAVACMELRLRGPGREAGWRVVISLPSGHEHGEEHVDVYRETLQPHVQSETPETTHALVYTPAVSGSDGGAADLNSGVTAGQEAQQQASRLAGKQVLGPYPPLQPIQQRRLAARRHNVTYCYDWPTVFETALRDVWTTRAASGEPHATPPAGRLVEVQELVLSPPASGTSAAAAGRMYRAACPLSRANRPPGLNQCGMVAWVMNLKTPECPQGRQIVAVSNDLTFQSGAFSPSEDAVFRGAAEWAAEERLPLVYLAANSGARVGLAVEVRERLQVGWHDASDPSKGFSHLYLTEPDYLHLNQLAEQQGSEVVRAARQIAADGSVQWVLSDVVGVEDGLGVECLSGSGAIAAAYNKAFREGYTITLVSGRTVGIGAYLARLGRRCVQRADQPIVLTGFAALNKLLGRPVYSSHMQLGGPRVMAANGVSHHVVADDLEGVRIILSHLSFCPPLLPPPGSAALPSHPVLPTSDTLDRPVGYCPAAGEKLDPRAAIAGRQAPGGEWQSGLFDRGSWLESHANWARTVVTGRARLGGVPVGVVAVEVQTVVRHQPADPGMPDSTELNLPQAGQVWYPDSASKTAAAIEEFQLEGLPLIILANWRGFSGGQKDLFDGVLQAGSLIVEALRTYKHPVTVYIPANAELRGGAWVVVDGCINSLGSVEMYADPSARGGVLEPEGVVEIKFRKPDLIKLMHRTDPVILAAKAEQAKAAQAAPGAGAGAQGEVQVQAAESNPEVVIKAREKALLPVYQQVACAFADMHDTPVRMLSKGVLRGIVPWASARHFLGLRLKRRLREQQLAAHIAITDPALPRPAVLELLRSWHASSLHVDSPRGPAGSHAALHTTLTRTSLESALSHNASAATNNTMVASSDHTAQLMAEDRSFLEWSDSGEGRAALAAELRALRMRAASQLVSQVLVSQEGREGMLAALASAVSADPGLAAQLRALLNKTGAAFH